MLHYFKVFLEYLNYWMELNKKYKLKLIFMLISIFSVYLIVIAFLISTQSFENSAIDIIVQQNSLLKKIGDTVLLKGFIKFFISRWNFGPSIETLLGASLMVFFLLILLIILSSYIKLFLIPLIFLSSIIFSNIIKVVSSVYHIENFDDIIFNKFGLILKKKEEFIEPLNYHEISAIVDKLYFAFLEELKNNNKVVNSMDQSIIDIKLEILGKNFKNINEATVYSNDLLQKSINFSDKSFFTGIIESLPSFVTPMNTVIFLGALGTAALIYYMYSGGNDGLVNLLKGQLEISKDNKELIGIVKDTTNIMDDKININNQKSDILVDGLNDNINIQKKLIELAEGQQNLNKLEEAHGLSIDMIMSSQLKYNQDNTLLFTNFCKLMDSRVNNIVLCAADHEKKIQLLDEGLEFQFFLVKSLVNIILKLNGLDLLINDNMNVADLIKFIENWIEKNKK